MTFFIESSANREIAEDQMKQQMGVRILSIHLAMSCIVAFSALGFAQSQSRAPSSKRLSADKSGSYNSIKKIMMEDPAAKWRATGTPKNGLLDISTCAGNPEIRGAASALIYDLFNRSFWVLRFESAMNANKIPNNYWQDILANYERGRPISKDEPVGSPGVVARTITARLKNAGLHVRTIIADECGGGPAEYRVVTNPPGGLAHIMPKVMYLYCLSKGDDPENPKQCDHWHPPIKSGQRVNLGGVYRYKIQRQGRFGGTSEFDADRYETERTIVLE